MNLMKRLFAIAALALLVLLATASASEAVTDRSCEDFSSPAELARHLEKYPGDADRLDGDGDGLYCDDRAAVPTSVPAGSNGLPERGDPAWPWLVGIGTLFAVSGAVMFDRATR